MKIAIINENSQAPKNGIIEAALKKVVEPMGHEDICIILVIIVLIIIATCIICRCRLPVYIDSVCSCITALRLAFYLNCIISDSKRIASCA